MVVKLAPQGQYQWGTAINSLLGTYNFPQGYVQADVPNATSLWVWYQYIDDDVKPDTSIMAGYSLGGVASRDLAQYEDIAGLITVGSPHTGAPIAGSISSAQTLVGYIESDLSLVLSVGSAEILEALSSLGESLYWDVVAIVDNAVYLAVDYLVNVGYGYLDYFPSGFTTDLPPGSSFMSQLPTGIANSYTLSVEMYPGHFGGPLALAMSQEAADDEGEFLAYWGNQLQWTAYDAQFYIDWGHEHAYTIYDALVAAAQLGGDLVNFPLYWCGGVTSGNVFGSCSFSSDGLIPTSRQTFSGVTGNTSFPNGPSHTYELVNATTISFVGGRLCFISPGCS